MSNRTPRLLSALVVCAALFASCIEPEVVTASGQRVSAPAVETAVAATAEPLLEPAATPTPPAVPDESPTAMPETAPAPTSEAADPGTAEPEDADVVVTDAVIPGDLCDAESGDVVAGAVSWSDIDLGRDTSGEGPDYVNATGDANESFINGTLSCTSTFIDGSTLTVSAYSNYATTSFPGTRVSASAAGSVDVVVAAEPTAARGIVEYPWAPSPTGFAAVEVTFIDAEGISSSEIDAVEAAALAIRDRTTFDPPAVAGPAYPSWYTCSLTQFATPTGDTALLAAALGQPLGLHAVETIDRQFGTSRCSLYEGSGENSSGGFAVSGVFVALAAYESGRSTFTDTVQQVVSSPGVVQGDLTVAGRTYRTLSAPGSLAVILENGGNGVMSVFDPAGAKTVPQLQAIMAPILAQLFPS